MNIATVPAASGTRASWRLATFLGLVGVAAFVFVGVAALPYYLSPSFGPPEYAPRRGWLMLHISGGLVALLTGPVQLWLGLADRGMVWHRRMGTAYVVAVATGAIGGYYMAFATDFGWLFGASLATLATAWVTTTGMAVLAIKRSLIEQHKEWMIRSYVLTFAFVLFRLVLPALQAAQIGTVPEQLAAAGWLSWTLPLLAAELILQGQKILRVRA
jgi:uncharacterized membrane protein